MKYFAITVIVIVFAAIIGGFFIAGSPQQERLRRFDTQRIGDLQGLQSQIVSYWQSKGKLPDSLSLLADSLRGITVPVDPQTAKPYGYEIRGSLTFALCADFALADTTGTGDGSVAVAPAPKSVPAMPGVAYPDGGTWQHGVGHTCFERTIDKDFFKPPAPPGGQ